MVERVLIIGSAGREQAIAHKLRLEGHDVHLEPLNVNLHSSDDEARMENVRLAKIAKKLRATLTVVGPDLVLANGIVDHFRAQKLDIVGPTRKAARLESSKLFGKQFASKYDIPTAAYEPVYSSGEAKGALQSFTYPVVIKADGLMEGKGVFVMKEKGQAMQKIEELLIKTGKPVIVEQFLRGAELSYHVLSNGIDFVPLLPSRDYKTLNDYGEGPNTGGMGSFAPVNISSTLDGDIMSNIIRPTIDGMKENGTEFRGVLFPGLMRVNNKPVLLEFNCRAGDPEIESILALMNSRLSYALKWTAEPDSAPVPPITWKPRSAVTVVMTSGGYPGPYEVGIPIEGLNNYRTKVVTVLHAATTFKNGVYLTNGGRVLDVVATGERLYRARARAYNAVEAISWPGEHHRNDIGLEA
jgi:phosphoribosylamine---glycine ligase